MNMENQTDTQSVDKIDNPEVLALTLQTPVNRKYDGPNADNPNVLPGKCFWILLLPRILDVLCFWVAAGVFLWNQTNDEYKYFAVRILNPESTTDFLHTFIEPKTILITAAFAVITAVVFWLRVIFIKAKRAKQKEAYPLPKQAFPKANIRKGSVFFSTVFLGIVLVAAHFVVSLILKKQWKDMPITVDLGITAGIFALLNLRACLKVNNSAIRCYVCHVISGMMNQEIKVAETFYADATFATPEGQYTVTQMVKQGKRILRSTTTEHSYGQTRTYENVRHDRVRAAVRCPYCLQVYDEVLVNINDTLEGKKLKSVGSYENVKTHYDDHPNIF